MAQTPNSERLHIVLFGRTNSGKSSLINALTGQEVALVSDRPGTTTDPVRKAMEVQGLGACTFVDTAGFDDTDEILGELRIQRTRAMIKEADIAIIVISSPDISEELKWIQHLRNEEVALFLVINKIDARAYPPDFFRTVEAQTGLSPIPVSTLTGVGIETLRAALASYAKEGEADSITGDLVSSGDLVLLVMPQDSQAPKGRLILPQVQTIRELLDKGAVPLCCTPETMRRALDGLSQAPKLIITDSQAFKPVYDMKPAESLLTSFSVLFAAYKGDIRSFVEGAKAIALLTPESRVLIAEACTHAPETEDIGTVKIPRLLHQRVGESLKIEMVSGKAFPEDLTPYDLIIHCGACMFTRKLVISRSRQAHRQAVPMTNYGIALAYLTGILDKVALPGHTSR